MGRDSAPAAPGGAGVAKELILGGGQINAQRAYEIGLVNRVLPAASLMEETKKFAKKLASMPAFAVKMAKYSINYGYDWRWITPISWKSNAARSASAHRIKKEGMRLFSKREKADIHREINVQSSKIKRNCFKNNVGLF